MTFPNINPQAMKLINFFDDAVQEKVKVCTSRYTPPKEWTGYFSYLLHRIWNAVKSLFNASDWQVAKQAIIDVEFKEPANLFKKILPAQDKELKQIFALDFVFKLKGVKLPTIKEVQDNQKTTAEDFLIEILKTNLNSPKPKLGKDEEEALKKEKVEIVEPKPTKTTLSELVKTKENLALLVEMRKGFNETTDPLIQEFIAEEMNLDNLKKVLKDAKDDKERQEYLALFTMMGIDHDTFLELQKEIKT